MKIDTIIKSIMRWPCLVIRCLPYLAFGLIKANSSHEIGNMKIIKIDSSFPLQLCIDSQIGCYKGRRPAARTETFIRACSVLLYTEDLTYEKSDPSDLCIHFHILQLPLKRLRFSSLEDPRLTLVQPNRKRGRVSPIKCLFVFCRSKFSKHIPLIAWYLFL